MRWDDLGKGKNLMLTVLAVAWMLSPGFLQATAQVYEILRFEGQVFSMGALPFESYPGREAIKIPMESTACWRGYRGEWEIRDDRLYLVALTRCDDTQNIWRQILPKTSPPLAATWFNGIVRLPQGRMLAYVHMGFASVHERDLYLVIRDGVLVGRFDVRNDIDTLSYRDRQRVSIGHADAIDGVEFPPTEELLEADWHDSMTLRKTLSEDDPTSVTVRGHWFADHIFLHGNGAAPEWELPINIPESLVAPGQAVAVEADIVLEPQKGYRRFTIQAVRSLASGEWLDRRRRVKAVDWSADRKDEDSPRIGASLQ